MRVLMVALLLAQTMTPSDLLQRSAKATGTLNAGTYTEHYVADGQAEHIDGVKQIAGDDYTVVERAGEFVVMWVRYNGQRWHQDENGVVLLDGGFHLKTDDDAQLGASGAERKMRVIGLTPDGVDYVLDFELLDGYHEKRYYNAKTSLLDRIERPADDGYTHVRAFSDYRQVAGEMVPFAMRYSDSRPENSVETRVLSFDHSQAQLGGVPQGRSLLGALPGGGVPLPVAFTDFQEIVVRVSVNGHPLNFALDTGADGLLIDAAAAHDCGLILHGKSRGTIGGDFDISRTSAADFSMGSLHLHDIAFYVAPFKHQTPAGNIVGLLGADFLASAIVGIDFKKQTVTLYPPTGAPPDPNGLFALPIEVDDGVPRGQASIEGVAGHFLIDTGSFGTMLFQKYFDQLPVRMPFKVTGSMGTPRYGGYFVGGPVDMNGYTFNDFAFAGTLFKSAAFLVPTRSIADESDYDGILGRDILKYYLLYFDYAGRAIYLKPNI